MDVQEKLEILADAAKYDVACTSSGLQRRSKAGYVGNALGAGCCHRLIFIVSRTLAA